jgi:hypothetical protein
VSTPPADLEDIALAIIRGHLTRVKTAMVDVTSPDPTAGMLDDLLDQTLRPLNSPALTHAVLHQLLAKVGAYAGIAIYLLERDLGLDPQRLFEYWRDNADTPADGGESSGP